jgi:hypothetical protein
MKRRVFAWVILWPWFLLNRLISRGEDDWKCKCGEWIATDDRKWSGIHSWKNKLILFTDIRPSYGEYSGEDWTTHVICWKCGRHHEFSDSSY